MAADITDLFAKVSVDNNIALATTVTAARTAGETVLACFDLSKYALDTPVFVITYKKVTDPVTGEVTTASQTGWKALVNADNNTLTNLTLAPGYTDVGNAIGDFVECIPTSYWANSLIDGILVSHEQDGKLRRAAVLESLGINAAPSPDWATAPSAPSTVVCNGQRSYSLTFPGVDLTTAIQPGTRIRTTRNTIAPTQSTSLNGTSQYWVKTAPNKMTFTDDFTVMAHVYLTEYGAQRNIISRRTANDGFSLRLNGYGQIEAVVVNAGTSNRVIISVQAVPLNTWTHIAATYDISGGVYNIYINGISVLTYSTSAGAMTSIVQSGNLEVGSATAGGFFKGNIAQVAIFSSILNQSTVRSYISQGLTGSEPTLLSAWSFNGVATDLMTTTPNDLTPQASAGYSALSPFGTQGNGTISSTLDYAIVQAATFSTDTTLIVQVPDGCTIPTSGTVSAISYSPVKSPYGFPTDKKRWTITARMVGNGNVVGGTKTGSIAGVWGELALARVFLPVGVFFQYSKIIIVGSSTSANFALQSQYDPISPAAAPGYDSEGGDRHRMNVAGAFLVATHRHVQTVVNNSPQDFKLWCAITGGSGTQEAYFEVGIPNTISFENAYL